MFLIRPIVTRSFVVRVSQAPSIASCRHRSAMASSFSSPGPLHPRAEQVLDFWLGSGWARAGPTYLPLEQSQLWFKGSAELDKEITERFGQDCEAFAQGKYDDWQNRLYDCLAGIVVGDQLTRNVLRGSARMFENDARALAWAKALVASNAHSTLKPVERIWVYMPYMHSEDLRDQQECVGLFQQLAEECGRLEGREALAKMAGANVRYAELHRDIIARWSRFPHRNALLGRTSTPEEEAGLADGSILRF